MKYHFMDRYGSGFEVMKMCRVLGVSRSGYYAYLRRGLNRRHEENRGLLTKIREIVGWTLYKRMTKELVANALMKAFAKRDPEPGLIFHSDRGSQYASHRVGRILNAWQIQQSMSSRGDCFDNAIMESFFGSLKKELVHLRTFHSRSQAKSYVFDYIEIFYNRQRRHSALNYKTPLEYYLENQA